MSGDLLDRSDCSDSRDCPAGSPSCPCLACCGACRVCRECHHVCREGRDGDERLGRPDHRGGHPVRGDDREASVETLRYALNGFLSAVRADRLARASGSDSPQVQRHRVLVTLADELDLDSAGLADVLGMRPAHVTGLLDALGREGLVEGVRAGRGRGGPVARLTPAGLRALDELDTVFRRHWESAVADLPAGDLRTAARVISRLTGVIIPTR